MNSKPSSWLLSVWFVVAINSAVLLFCLLSLLDILPTSLNQSLPARALPCVAPVLTGVFLLAGRRSAALAAFAVIANVLVLALGVTFLALLVLRSFPITGSLALIGFMLLCVFVPLVSGLAVASRWPSRGSVR